VRLQTYAAEHVAAVQAFLSDPEILAFTPVPEPVPDDHAARWLARFDAGRREGSSDAWVVLEDDAVLGFACAPHLSRTTGDLEIGYIVSPGARRRGVATWVLGELTEWALGWGAVRVELHINADNAGSRRVAERCGYVLEGTSRSTYLKPGRRVDTTIWSRLASDP